MTEDAPRYDIGELVDAELSVHLKSLRVHTARNGYVITSTTEVDGELQHCTHVARDEREALDVVGQILMTARGVVVSATKPEESAPPASVPHVAQHLRSLPVYFFVDEAAKREGFAFAYIEKGLAKGMVVAAAWPPEMSVEAMERGEVFGRLMKELERSIRAQAEKLLRERS